MNLVQALAEIADLKDQRDSWREQVKDLTRKNVELERRLNEAIYRIASQYAMPEVEAFSEGAEVPIEPQTSVAELAARGRNPQLATGSHGDPVVLVDPPASMTCP